MKVEQLVQQLEQHVKAAQDCVTKIRAEIGGDRMEEAAEESESEYSGGSGGDDSMPEKSLSMKWANLKKK